MTGTPDDHALKLAHMAGQIATFFEAYPREEAVEAVAGHINQFWSRHMREGLLEAFTPDDPRLHPLVQEAMARVKGREKVTTIPVP